MRLTVIGCSGSVPGPESPASCYLVEADGYRMLLDLGNGALGALYRHASPYAIDTVLLSHLHPDHVADLAALYVARRYHPDGPFPPIPVHGPPGTDRRLASIYGMSELADAHRAFTFTDWVDRATYEIGPFRVAVRQMVHPRTCFAMRVEHGGRSLVYSGDTAATDALVELARRADVLLCEAAYADSDGHNPPGLHLTGTEAGEHAQRAEVGRLLVTHIPPWIHRGAQLEAATAAFRGPTELAAAGTAYDI